MSDNNKKWVLSFDSELDFLRYSSMIIGASYTSGDDAIMRINNRAGANYHHGEIKASYTDITAE